MVGVEVVYRVTGLRLGGVSRPFQPGVTKNICNLRVTRRRSVRGPARTLGALDVDGWKERFHAKG